MKNNDMIRELARLVRRDCSDVLEWADPDGRMSDFELSRMNVQEWLELMYPSVSDGEETRRSRCPQCGGMMRIAVTGRDSAIGRLYNCWRCWSCAAVVKRGLLTLSITTGTRSIEIPDGFLLTGFKEKS